MIPRDHIGTKLIVLILGIFILVGAGTLAFHKSYPEAKETTTPAVVKKKKEHVSPWGSLGHSVYYRPVPGGCLYGKNSHRGGLAFAPHPCPVEESK